MGVSPFSGKNDNELLTCSVPGPVSGIVTTVMVLLSAKMFPGPGVESAAESSNRYSVHLLPPA